MAMDLGTVGAGFLIAVGNVGGVGLLVNRALNKLDATEKTTNEHSVLIARAAENQIAAATTLKQVQESVEELYDSRNYHEGKLVAVEVLHKTKGCDRPIQGA